MTFDLDVHNLDTPTLLSLRDEINDELSTRRRHVPDIRPNPDDKTYYMTLANLELCVHSRVSPLVQSNALCDLLVKRFPEFDDIAKSKLLPSTPQRYAYMQRHDSARTLEFQL